MEEKEGKEEQAHNQDTNLVVFNHLLHEACVGQQGFG